MEHCENSSKEDFLGRFVHHEIFKIKARTAFKAANFIF